MIIATVVSCVLFLIVSLVLRIRGLERINRELLSDLKKEYFGKRDDERR